jgi:serine protease AprX
MVDSGFYPHPDLVLPHNRIRAWVEAGYEPVRVLPFSPDETPRWPGWDAAEDRQWHGMMTSVVAAGNGMLGHSLYRGLASEADLVLIQVRDAQGRITNESIGRALRWLLEHGAALGVQVVNLSVSGDAVRSLAGNPVDEAVTALMAAGVTVVAAAGNDGKRSLAPPATAPAAVTVGGLDDHNSFEHKDVMLWHSNYGEGSNGVLKPELVAPSIWVAAPILPGTALAAEARQRFARRNADDEARMAELKLITPHYQHVDGTSFAAPLVASTVACMLEANPQLSPRIVRDVLQKAACAVPGISLERQGAGALDAGRSLALALRERHRPLPPSPHIEPGGCVTFTLHDHHVRNVQVLGSWNGWGVPGLPATCIEEGVWQAAVSPFPSGQYGYKFLLDGSHWLDDPANPHKMPDGLGGLNSVLRV